MSSFVLALRRAVVPSCLVLAVACGTPPVEPEVCGPSTCAGCCQGQVCVTGDSSDFCGSGGQACDFCPAASEQCVAHVCVAKLTSAGGGGGSNGGGSAGGGAVGGGSAGGGAVGGGSAGGGAVGGGSAGGGSAGGGSAGGGSAGGGGMACISESNASLCARNTRSCGALTATDNCGVMRSIATCGTCTTPAMCTTQGTCACTAETDADFCKRSGKACGAASGTDNCGKARTVQSCGTCTGANTCNTGVCSCPSETNTSFCQRLGAKCGSVSGTDVCGNPKSVASCGGCASPQTCGGGGMANQCGCTPQTNEAFCAARGKDCGMVTGADNCGVSRTTTCGVCTAPETCGGANVANVCGCTPESNPQLCTRLGLNCGTVTVADNCGTTRTMSCGTTCTNPNTCGGGGMANVCGCTGESDAAFCSRLGKNCGQTTGVDSCGRTRTVASCGTCSGLQSCSGGGVLNVCGGRNEPMQKVCGQGFCWENPYPVGVTLTSAKTSPQGSNWVAGDVGTVLQWTGSTWRGWFAVANVRLNAVWPVSDSEVWAVGTGGTIVRFDGTSWSQVASGVTTALRGVWGASDGTLWAVGDQGVVLKRVPGGAWVRETVPSTAQLNAVFGVGGDVWVVGKGVILRFNGSTWSATASTWDLADVWGASATDVWAVSWSGVMRFTGTQWTQSTAAKGRAVFGTSATNVWVANDSSTMHRFDGLSWATSAPEPTGGWVNGLAGLTGSASDGTLLAVGDSGVMYRHDGQRWHRLTRGELGLAPSRNVTMNELCVAGGQAIAVGSNYGSSFGATTGLMFRWANGATSVAHSTTSTLLGCQASPAGTAWALEENRLWRHDGTAWVSFTTPTNRSSAFTALSTTDAWVVSGDRTDRFNGATFSPVPNPVSTTSTFLYAVAAVAPNHVWAGGSAGTLLFFDGAAWSSKPSGVGLPIAQIRMLDASSGYASGQFGVIRWNGTAWGPTARTTGVRSVWPESASTYWALNQYELVRWDGTQFVNMAPWLSGSNSLRLADVRGENGVVWVLGERGELLRR